jgi:excisionase family DNA binding protein
MKRPRSDHPQSPGLPPIFYTIEETAQILGVSYATLRRMKRRGEIGFVTVGTGQKRPRIRFTSKHIEEWALRAERVPDALPAARTR